jgi:hypothetical protein
VYGGPSNIRRVRQGFGQSESRRGRYVGLPNAIVAEDVKHLLARSDQVARYNSAVAPPPHSLRAHNSAWRSIAQFL